MNAATLKQIAAVKPIVNKGTHAWIKSHILVILLEPRVRMESLTPGCLSKIAHTCAAANFAKAAKLKPG